MYPDYNKIRSQTKDEDFIRDIDNLLVDKMAEGRDCMQMTADYLAELLMDDGNSTFKMYEQLISDYLNNNEDYRKGLDAACEILTGYSFRSISADILNILEEKENEEDKEV